MLKKMFIACLGPLRLHTTVVVERLSCCSYEQVCVEARGKLQKTCPLACIYQFVSGRNFKMMNTDNLIEAYYGPSDSYELMDPETGQFYNRSGQELRDPEEYDPNSESYTPFGDE